MFTSSVNISNVSVYLEHVLVVAGPVRQLFAEESAEDRAHRYGVRQKGHEGNQVVLLATHPSYRSWLDILFLFCSSAAYDTDPVTRTEFHELAHGGGDKDQTKGECGVEEECVLVASPCQTTRRAENVDVSN